MSTKNQRFYNIVVPATKLNAAHDALSTMLKHYNVWQLKPDARRAIEVLLANVTAHLEYEAEYFPEEPQ